MKPTGAEQISPPTTLSRDLARRVLGLGVGVVVAMAPFLGYVKVPGFEALFNLLPFQIQSEIAALSAFVVSLITASFQFYVAEKISRRALRRVFKPWQRLLEQQIGNIKSAAVFVGSAGVGPWQEQELRGFLSEFVSRRCPVIPVLLPDAPEKPELPIFLKAYTWVDFRIQDPDPLGRLIWGITGKRPDRPDESV